VDCVAELVDEGSVQLLLLRHELGVDGHAVRALALRGGAEALLPGELRLDVLLEVDVALREA
jgi:hypothetical protein